MADVVKLTDSSRERVALDLAIRIYADEKAHIVQTYDRTYWLKLYYQCFRAALGHEPE